MLKSVKEFVEECKEKSICSSCGRGITKDNLRDETSLKEYRLSALCQECQDSIFGR